MQKLNEALNFLKSKLNETPKLTMVLGSGLSEVAEEFEITHSFDFSEIPNFPVSSVSGHAGKLLVCKIKSNTVLIMQGRVHFYEGYDLDEVVFPIRLTALLGIKNLMITNAAGSLNADWPPGNIMIFNDIINFTGNNPLIGKNNDDWGPRFPDMTNLFHSSYSKNLESALEKEGLQTRKGTYIGVTGPSYESPAEIKMFKIFGADAVGMSTVPEVIAARHMGLNIFGFSCLTNFGSGISDVKLTHEDVKKEADKVKLPLKKGIMNFLENF